MSVGKRLAIEWFEAVQGVDDDLLIALGSAVCRNLLPMLQSDASKVT